MKKYNYDISDDYHDFKEESWFHKNLGKQFKMDIYMSDSEDNSDNSDNLDINSNASLVKKGGVFFVN